MYIHALPNPNPETVGHPISLLIKAGKIWNVDLLNLSHEVSSCPTENNLYLRGAKLTVFFSGYVVSIFTLSWRTHYWINTRGKLDFVLAIIFRQSMLEPGMSVYYNELSFSISIITKI